MAQAKRELFKSAEVCELTALQPYVLRSWESEFPSLGQPAASGVGRIYRRADVELVLRIKQLVFVEGLTLAGARRRLEEEQQTDDDSMAALAVDHVLSDMARSKLREVRAGLESILALVSRDAGKSMGELQLVAPTPTPSRGSGSKRRRAG